MKTLIVIPARLGSWRFPDKPLTMIEGLPMVEHVYRRSLLAANIDEVVVAVCEEKLVEACRVFGAKVIMTSKECQTATDRVAEAAKTLGYIGTDSIVINVQGDEPVVPPPVIEMTTNLIGSDPKIKCVNLVEEVKDPSDLHNEHRIKAVLSINNRLIYLTRQAIPAAVFDIKNRAVFYRQTCVMAFRGDALQAFSQLRRTPLELIEGIDMLRLIEHDLPITSGISQYITQPVDTPADIAKVKVMLKTDEWFKSGYAKRRQS